MFFLQADSTQSLKILSDVQFDVTDVIFCFRAVLCALTIDSMFDSVPANTVFRVVVISLRAVDKKFVQPVARLLHIAKKLSKAESSAHLAKLLSHLSDAVMHTEISFVHVAVVLVFVASFFWDVVALLLTTTALQDFSINSSYMSVTSSGVQFCIFFRHNSVAQT